MKPRNPNKPFLQPGQYASLWFDAELKHFSTIPSDLNRVDLMADCDISLKNFPDGFSYVIVIPIANSLISTHTPRILP
jgi:hypothetical protein